MDPLKYYNFKNSLEITEMMSGDFYHFKAVFNGGFISGMYSFRFNAIVDPVYGQELTMDDRSEITGFLKLEIERLREQEDKLLKNKDELE